MAESWPGGIVPYRCNFYLRNNTTVFTSPLTGSRQALRRQGARWVSAIGLRLSRAETQQIDVLLGKLSGAYGTVRIGDFSRSTPTGTNLDRGSIADTRFADTGPPTTTTFTDSTVFDGGAAGVVVWGAWAIGSRAVLADGFPQNTTQLLAGDYVEIGGYLYMLTADAVADALGRATLSLNRGLVIAAAHLDVITRTNPTTPMMLVDDDQPDRGREAGSPLYIYTLSLIEAIG